MNYETVPCDLKRELTTRRIAFLGPPFHAMGILIPDAKHGDPEVEQLFITNRRGVTSFCQSPDRGFSGHFTRCDLFHTIVLHCYAR